MPGDQNDSNSPWKLCSRGKHGFGVTKDSHASRRKRYKVRLFIKGQVLELGR
jgi:hypothetical protein